MTDRCRSLLHRNRGPRGGGQAHVCSALPGSRSVEIPHYGRQAPGGVRKVVVLDGKAADVRAGPQLGMARRAPLGRPLHDPDAEEEDTTTQSKRCGERLAEPHHSGSNQPAAM